VMFDDRYSDDAIFNGRIKVRQRREGYRFSIDALLLAWYASAIPGGSALELGSGCGVVSLALASKRPKMQIDALEIQDSLFELALFNVRANGLKNVEISRLDLREIEGARWEHRYDLVFSNPPFRAVGRGRLNPEPEKARARHELLATLDDVVSCAARTLKPDGSAAVVLLPEREAELDKAAADNELAIVHKCLVKPYASRMANILLVLLRTGSIRKAIESELVLYDEAGDYSALARAIIDGQWDRIEHPLSETAGLLPEIRTNN